jgi:hypothetical protein
VFSQVFLNDWGCAAKIDELHPPAGALSFYPTAILRTIATIHPDAPRFHYTVEAWHDLEMLVKARVIEINSSMSY